MPMGPRLAITPRQPLVQGSHDLIGEPAQASTVATNDVGEVAPHHRGQVAMLVAERQWRLLRHQSLTAATARAKRLLAVTCRSAGSGWRGFNRIHDLAMTLTPMGSVA